MTSQLKIEYDIMHFCLAGSSGQRAKTSTNAVLADYIIVNNRI